MTHEQNFLVHKLTRAIPSLEIRYETVQIRDLMKTERMKIPVFIKINWRSKHVFLRNLFCSKTIFSI